MAVVWLTGLCHTNKQFELGETDANLREVLVKVLLFQHLYNMLKTVRLNNWW